MRFYEGDHAYEVERVLDPATQLYTGWRSIKFTASVPATSFFVPETPRRRRKHRKPEEELLRGDQGRKQTAGGRTQACSLTRHSPAF